MHKYKIAITGATGFVGAHLVRHFGGQESKILAIGRQSSPPNELLKYADWMQGDISGKLDYIDAEIVIHAAALTSDIGNRDQFMQSNLTGTKHVWEAAKGCKVFIYISSASVYTFAQPEVTEKDLGDEKHLALYGASKRKAEEYLKSRPNEDTSVVILRPRAIYGTHDRVLLPRILNMMKKNSLVIPDCMKVKTSMTHISNLIEAIRLACRTSKSFGIYNVADEDNYILEDIIKALTLGLRDNNSRTIHIPYFFLRAVVTIKAALRMTGGFTHQSLYYVSRPAVLNLTKIKKDLGYKAKTNFWTELPRLHGWIQQVGEAEVRQGSKTIPWLPND